MYSSTAGRLDDRRGSICYECSTLGLETGEHTGDLKSRLTVGGVLVLVSFHSPGGGVMTRGGLGSSGGRGLTATSDSVTVENT